jgi:hypothetical protein
MIKNLVIAYVLFSTPSLCDADSIARTIGNAIGEFSAGVGSSVGTAITTQQPQWITINPRPKKECIAEAGGVINTIYVRCRNGRQEWVRFDENHNKIVLQERSIPMH